MQSDRKKLGRKVCISLICAISIMLSSCTSAISNKAPIRFKQHSVKAYSHEFSKVAFVPNSKIIATIGMDGNATNYLKLWDYSNPDKMTVITTNGITSFGSAQSIATNQAKNVFAIAGESDRIEDPHYSLIDVYQFNTRKRVQRIKINLNRQEGFANQKISFSSDGNVLACSASSLRLWNTRDWKLSATISGNPEGRNKDKIDIVDYVISPDSKWVATLTNAAEVRLWDVRTGQLLSQGQQPLGIIAQKHKVGLDTYNGSQLHLSPDGKFLYVVVNFINPPEAIRDVMKFKSAGVAFYKWDLINHELASVNLIDNFSFYTIAFDPAGEYFAMSGYHELSEVSLWNPETFTRIQTLVKGEGSYYDVKISSDGKHIAAAQDYGKLFLWQEDLVVSKNSRSG